MPDNASSEAYIPAPGLAPAATTDPDPLLPLRRATDPAQAATELSVLVSRILPGDSHEPGRQRALPMISRYADQIAANGRLDTVAKLAHLRQFGEGILPLLRDAAARTPATRHPVELPHGGGFPSLFTAALAHRARAMIEVLSQPPAIPRATLRPFYLTAGFGDILARLIHSRIGPGLYTTCRAVTDLERSRDWIGAGIADIWAAAGPRTLARIDLAWGSAWGHLFPSAAAEPRRAAHSIRQHRTDHTVADVALRIARSVPQAVMMVFSSLPSMNDAAIRDHWRYIGQIYAQEFERSTTTGKIRDGAFRDALITTFDKYPTSYAEMVVLACHYTFMAADRDFIERFTRNFGSTASQRAARLPLLTDFLTNDDT